MSVSYFQRKIGKGISLSGVYDNKFKTNLVAVRFVTKLNRDTAPLNSLLSALLGTSNSNVKSRTKLNEKLIGLYDSQLKSFAYTMGDYQITGISIRYIGDDYTLNNEKVSEEAIKILLDCILNPDINDNRFPEKYFELRKKELIEDIKSEINDRRGYAALRASEFIYQNEPASIYENGTVEQVEKITQSDLYNAYCVLLRNSYIDISVVGGGKADKAEKLIIDSFSNLKRDYNSEINFNCPSIIKHEAVEIKEQYEVNQSKMIMAFKTENEDFYAQKLMCAMFGGTSFSYLFANVREKLSLCYYCSSHIAECKKTMIINSGIEKENVEKAKSEILHQFSLIADGDFSDELLENTKKALYNGFRSNYDSVLALNSWYFTQRVRGTQYSPDEVNEIINNVSRERVIQAAKSYTLDTVYVM
ncbi:MAG: EF-P 5-aminopentanol modification-associated protein YfmF, partial [Oscillospiraceae bacterium]